MSTPAPSFGYFRNSALDARAFNDFYGVTGQPIIPRFVCDAAFWLRDVIV